MGPYPWFPSEAGRRGRMQSWHLTFATDGRNPLCPEEGARLAMVRALARVAGEHAVLFCVVDDHIHLVVLCERQEAGRIAQRLSLALRPLAAVEVDPARVRPVESRSHLQSLVRYVLDQPRHHHLGEHPGLFAGSCFVDLVGARVLDGLKLRIQDALPRLRLRDVYQSVGLRPVRLTSATKDEIRAAGAVRLATAGAAALGVEPTLESKRPSAVKARTAVCRIGNSVGIPASELAFALGITQRAVRRLADRVVDERLLVSVALRLALEDAVREQTRSVAQP